MDMEGTKVADASTTSNFILACNLLARFNNNVIDMCRLHSESSGNHDQATIAENTIAVPLPLLTLPSPTTSPPAMPSSSAPPLSTTSSPTSIATSATSSLSATTAALPTLLSILLVLLLFPCEIGNFFRDAKIFDLQQIGQWENLASTSRDVNGCC